MKNAVIALFILFQVSVSSKNTTLWYKSYGEKENPAIVFVHGGPGYNSANFEFSTAQVLADKGYFVIVYDQRGSGRSKEVEGKYTLSEAISDLESIYKKNKITKATLIGHSWGGTLAAKFTEQKPKMVTRIIWTGSPLSYQMTFRNILSRCTKYYTETDDSTNLGYMTLISKMDTSSLLYSSYLFSHAMMCGLYQPEEPSENAKSIVKSLKENPDSKLLFQMDYAPVQGFYSNEKYTTLDMTGTIKNISKAKIPFYGIYGSDDGLFDNEQIIRIKTLLGLDNMLVIKNASHNVFIDQQEEFLNALVNFMK